MEPASRQRAVISSKLVPPPLPGRTVARPRLARLVNELAASSRLVWVCATAGAGKTTAVVQALDGSERPLAWLTLDDTDTAPGRLLTYLEAAIARVVPTVDGVARRALGARIPHAEAAGLLADAVETPLLLVVDEVERLAASDAALGVLGSLVRHAPPAVTVLLVTRQELRLGEGSREPFRPAPAIGETVLAFTADEAAVALERAGATKVDPRDAVEATGGWVAGVLFEAWRADDHVAGHGGEADPLHGYLSSQILGRLCPEERDFLVHTSVLSRVSAERAEALGWVGAGDLLVALRRQHLPVTWDEEAGALSCHPRFRQYLLKRLGRLPASQVAAIRFAHGRLLCADGLPEEAAEEMLAAGRPAEALGAIERAIGAVIERLDFPVAERWLEAIADIAPAEGSALPAAELMLSVGQEQYSRGAALGDRLTAAGTRDALLVSFDRAAIMLAWCYFHVGRIADTAAVAAAAPRAHEIQLTRYLLTLADRDDVEAVIPVPTGGPMDGLLLRVHWAHGNLRELRDRPASPWAAAVSGPWRVAALRASGQTERALQLLERVRTAEYDAGLHDLVGAEALLDLGRGDAAWAALARARAQIQLSGSVFLLLLSVVLEAKLELRLEHDPRRAREVLAALDRHPALRSYRFIAEQADTWHGLALLLLGEDGAALARLRVAADSMVAGNRILELPTAATYLAEAQWRAGNEDGADAAADQALEAAERQGSTHLLLQALADLPAVLARRMDAEPDASSRWHELARTLMAQGRLRGLELGAHVELRDFGAAAILVDGEVRQPRIRKSQELLACLLDSSERALERSQILDALFDGRRSDSTRAYLRQAIQQLRAVLPELIVVEGSSVELTTNAVVTTRSGRFETLLDEAARLESAERLDRLREALALYDEGEYFTDQSSPWIEERREHLSGLATAARLEAAELCFQRGSYGEAGGLVHAVLGADPFRERAWRLRIRIAHTVGDEDAVLDAYRRCRTALRGLGLEPSETTRKLVQDLRS